MKKLWELKEWVIPILLAVTITILLRVFVFNVNVVQGTSMCTTLYSGDVLICQKYDVNHIKRGDIISAWLDERNEYIVKRVIGLPNETIHIDENGYIYVDGILVDDEYQLPTVGIDVEYNDITLNEDEYYVIGDNRYGSYDSRFFGPIKHDTIRDVTVLRCFPLTLY